MCQVFGTEADGGIYPPIEDACPVESGIEAVVPAAEMRLHRDRAQAGIDPDEQKSGAVPEQVRQALAAEGIKYRPTEFHHSTLGFLVGVARSSRDCSDRDGISPRRI